MRLQLPKQVSPACLQVTRVSGLSKKVGVLPREKEKPDTQASSQANNAAKCCMAWPQAAKMVAPVPTFARPNLAQTLIDTQTTVYHFCFSLISFPFA